MTRQVIHGGNGYDDPIEVTLTEPADASKINRLYPLYDEAATSNLQAVLNASGEIVSRKVMADAFGDETFSIGGAAIDRVSIDVAKDASGDIGSVAISLRSTEELQPGSVAAGVRLAANDQNGQTLRTAETVASLTDPFTATATMSSKEWSSFIDGATSISIAATPSLRASAWGAAVPVLPAPAWATATLPVSSATYPVEVRESISDLTTRIAAIPSSSQSSLTLYEVPDLALLGTPDAPDDPSRLLVHSSFQALPFSDSTTHLIYVRARWLDPSTGTWLTPDPMGYRDSSNLYAYCGGDPVDCSDPDGMARRTKNGGSNWLGNLGDVIGVTGGWSQAASTALDALGNTLSDALMLDTWADANVVSWDSSLSGRERATAAGKGAGVAAVNLAGGEILGTAGKVGLKVPGVKNAVSKIAATAVGRVLATDVKVLANRAAAAVSDRIAARATTTIACDTVSATATDAIGTAAAHPLVGWTPEEVIAHAQNLGVSTPRDSFIAWSGLGPEGVARSKAYAAEFGGTTLEMTRGGSWLNGMDLYGTASPFTQVEADQIWRAISRSASEQASGQVRALLGQVRPSSFYQSIELPTLLNNRYVLGIEKVFLKPRFVAGAGGR